MNTNQLKQDFLPNEIVLKLYREFSTSDFEQRIIFFDNYAQSIKDTIDSEVFDIRYNNQIGFLYWEAGEYSRAIVHFKKVLEILKPQDHSFLYFHILVLLIRSSRMICNYSESLYWVEVGFSIMNSASSSFEKLDILGEYADLLIDTNSDFGLSTEIIAQIIDDLGFPEQLSDPIDTINSIRNTHRIWNRKLSEISMKKIPDKNSRINAFEGFKNDCPIG